jgi:hypothetical protein
MTLSKTPVVTRSHYATSFFPRPREIEQQQTSCGEMQTHPKNPHDESIKTNLLYGELWFIRREWT